MFADLDSEHKFAFQGHTILKRAEEKCEGEQFKNSAGDAMFLTCIDCCGFLQQVSYRTKAGGRTSKWVNMQKQTRRGHIRDLSLQLIMKKND